MPERTLDMSRKVLGQDEVICLQTNRFLKESIDDRTRNVFIRIVI